MKITRVCHVFIFLVVKSKVLSIDIIILRDMTPCSPKSYKGTCCFHLCLED